MIRRNVKHCTFTVAYAAGIITALVFPTTFLLVILAVLVICCCRK